ncbi:MAG: FHA domain-containing protein [Chloroflexi bacterium]|uniref:FHA domain-containing protein n=1 Tax=Candidatus Flexifilum breve TaxID=3140694 RepID=UPI00313641F8|nr:FHA domain-containing protein [Chloroflexota bacterium]
MMQSTSRDEDNQNSHEIQPPPSQAALINLQTKELSRLNAQRMDPIELPEPRGDQPPWRISLTIVDTNIQIAFEVADYVTLGRFSQIPSRGKVIDFSPFNIHDYGVSRIHATLQLQNNRVTICDNGSTNGTYLNGKRLKSSASYVLNEGDYVALGTLLLRFDLLYHPWK